MVAVESCPGKRILSFGLIEGVIGLTLLRNPGEEKSSSGFFLHKKTPVITNRGERVNEREEQDTLKTFVTAGFSAEARDIG